MPFRITPAVWKCSALRSLPSGGKNWLLAVEHDVTLLKHALSLMPAPTSEHGLEAFTDYLQQVRELIQEHDSQSADIPDDAAKLEESSVATRQAEETDVPHRADLHDCHAEAVGQAETRLQDHGEAQGALSSENPSDVHMLSSGPTLQSAISDPLGATTAGSEHRCEDQIGPDPEAHAHLAEVEAHAITHTAPGPTEDSTETAEGKDSVVNCRNENNDEQKEPEVKCGS